MCQLSILFSGSAAPSSWRCINLYGCRPSCLSPRLPQSAGYVWIHTATFEAELISSIVLGAFGTGGIGFAGGFFGPIIFMPGANQGPLLGIFITRPLGGLFSVRLVVSSTGLCGVDGERLHSEAPLANIQMESTRPRAVRTCRCGARLI